MDSGTPKISYNRLSSDLSSSTRSTDSSPPVHRQSPLRVSFNTRTSHHRRTGSSSKSSLPIPTILEDLHTKAQGTLGPTYPLLTRYLPNDIGLVSHHHPSGLLTSPPVLLSPESNCDQNCSSHLLGQGRSIFKYNRFKSGLPNHRFLCTPLSISPSDSSLTSLHWNWSILRQACLLAVFTCLAGILCVLVGLLISSPLSPCDEEFKWYQGAIFYEIFPASYQDTDGDGYGDFRGILRRLDYIQRLGVRAIRLNSVFSALDYPLEYEHIIDLKNVDPHLGRMRDFEDLVKECHQRGIRVVLDLNPTVTSDQHTWALHWQRGIDGYQHFYASANRSKAPPEMEDKYGPPPEDWELMQRTFGGHYVVNWSNPLVRKEYRRTLNFWIQAGVDGFYMKHLDKMHIHSSEDLHMVVRQWRDELDRFRLWSPNKNRILISSFKFAQHLQETMADPGSILSMFDLVDVPLYLRPNTSQSLTKQISSVESATWRSALESTWIMWHFGSADTFRFASRVDNDQREAAFHVLMMLPGSISIFYGDEIGLTDSYDPITGNVYRGGQFAPMLWTSDNTTGDFTNSTSEPWIPLTSDHLRVNVEFQSQVLTRFIRISQIRTKDIRNRDFRIRNTENINVFILERQSNQISDSTKFVLVANFDRHSNYSLATVMDDGAKILATTRNIPEKKWSTFNSTLSCGEAVVIEVKG